MEECLGQLLCPEDRKYTADDWSELMHIVPIGCAFIQGTKDDIIHKTQTIQKCSRIPVVVAADMEHGAVSICDESTVFTSQMGMAACNDPELMYNIGRITALESRSCGIHWTFSPVVDLILNFRNHVTNTRALGDRPALIIPLLRRLIAGLQHEEVMAACAKHFPGDGVDDRDQHLCTSVNSLPVDQWFELHGQVWQAAIKSDVMSIMAGHISFPAWQGFAIEPDKAPPATLCKKLQVDLLRKKLGFKGVLVSDAAPMIGISSRVPQDEIAWRNIAAGSDVFLFADPVKDFERLKFALRKGDLTEERVLESTRRILEMKARLRLYNDCFAPELSREQLVEHIAVAQNSADRSITMVREHPGLLPLPPRSRILTVTITVAEHVRPFKDLEYLDTKLQERGFEVEHCLNPSHTFLFDNMHRFDRILVNFYIIQHMSIGRIMMSGKEIMPFWRAFYTNATDKVVFTSFGNPYILYEQPHINNLLLAYSPEPVAQCAAVKTWCGEIQPHGCCPVRFPKIEVRPFVQN